MAELYLLFSPIVVINEEWNWFLADDLYFESPLKIVEYPDPILRARNKRINTFDENLRKLVEQMFDVMYKYVILLMFYFCS